MKERPINLKSHEVLEILQGRKTQLRRVVKPQPSIRCPFGEVGDRLWVREMFDPIYGQSPPDRVIEIDYRADHSRTNGWRIKDDFGARRWTPSIHMPRWASRILLEVVSVRVERLRDISEADAIAEGSYLDRCACLPRSKDRTPMHAAFKLQTCHIHGSEFSYLWESINGVGSWDDNPWVWVIEFKRIDKKGGAV